MVHLRRYERERFLEAFFQFLPNFDLNSINNETKVYVKTEDPEEYHSMTMQKINWTARDLSMGLPDRGHIEFMMKEYYQPNIKRKKYEEKIVFIEQLPSLAHGKDYIDRDGWRFLFHCRGD